MVTAEIKTWAKINNVAFSRSVRDRVILTMKNCDKHLDSRTFDAEIFLNRESLTI